jgi:hypothetical protein
MSFPDFVQFSSEAVSNFIDIKDVCVHVEQRMVLQCINGVGSNPVEGRTKI